MVFVRDGVVLFRVSGVDDKFMDKLNVILFKSFESLRVEFDLLYIGK